MEDVLDLYAQAVQPGVARLCLDERPCVLHGDVLAPLPLKPGAVTKQDYHYARNGTAVALLAYNIDTGQRYVEVRPQRTKQDYATFVQAAIIQLCPAAHRVAIVNDNLNTHTVGAFYETFDAMTARRLAQLVQFHYTPKHASWLNMAEIEFSALVRQCLDRRIATIEQLTEEVAAWVAERNAQAVTIHWSFTAQTARQKLQRHYQKVCSKN
jgi:hypothetical protein